MNSTTIMPMNLKIQILLPHILMSHDTDIESNSWDGLASEHTYIFLNKCLNISMHAVVTERYRSHVNKQKTQVESIRN